ncbi:MAG: hypothetical protein L0Y35_08890 [Flammeovirgaceae bacterium]|nr:hypothetical protein [Flammeovirgaceae bacterium]
MKLSGDNWNELNSRLRSYSEQPDESTWEKIAGAIPHKEAGWITLLKSAAGVSALVVYVLLNQPNRVDEIEISNRNNIDKVEIENEATKESQRDSSTDNATEKENAAIEQNKTKADEQKFSIFSWSDQRNTRAVGKKVKSKSKIDIHDLISEKSVVEKTDNLALAEVDNSTPNSFNEPAIDPNALLTENSVRGAAEPEPAKILKDSTHIENKANEPLEVKSKEKKDESQRKTWKGFTMYASITPQLSYQRVTPLANDQVVVDEFGKRSVLSSERFGFGFDAGVIGRINKKVEYYAGASFYKQNQTLGYYVKSMENNTVQPSGDFLYEVVPSQQVKEFNYSMTNLGFSGGVMYHFYGEKLLHKAGGGLTYQQGIRKSSQGETYNNAESSYMLYQLFYRNEYVVNDALHIFLQPTFSHSFYSNEKLEEPFKLKPYRVGLAFGITYQF